MRFITDGLRIRDEFGRHRVLHGMNLVQKGHRSSTDEGTFTERGFEGEWTHDDIVDLAARGFTLVRLGVMWAAVEPRPGEYDEAYLDWLASQLDLIHQSGMVALLDAHQDLYSQRFSDGAPNWATLTSKQYSPADLWSDAYLESPAVHEALDAFWANATGPGDVGLQDRFAAMWAHVVHRLGDHPAVLGYDLLNEPAPGSAAQGIFGTVLHVFAQSTGQDFEQLLADFADPHRKFAQLEKLENTEVHRAIGDALSPLLEQFETTYVHPFMTKVARAVREAEASIGAGAESGNGAGAIITREHNYFANLGIPSGQPALADDNWVYSPHGYDLTVDTEAVTMSSNTRARTIFSRCAETAERLGVPVIVGEWGALTLADGVRDHAIFLLDEFDSSGWSWTYWVWEKGFADSEAARTLTRPRPIAFAGDGKSWHATQTSLTASWTGAEGSEPSVFFIPSGVLETSQVQVSRNGEPISAVANGSWLSVPAGAGAFELRVG